MESIDSTTSQKMVSLVQEAVRIAREAGYASADIDELLHTAVVMSVFDGDGS
jgi:adenosine deaminase